VLSTLMVLFLEHAAGIFRPVHEVGL